MTDLTVPTEWYHLVFNYVGGSAASSGDSVVIYHNGAEVGRSTQKASISNNAGAAVVVVGRYSVQSEQDLPLWWWMNCCFSIVPSLKQKPKFCIICTTNMAWAYNEDNFETIKIWITYLSFIPFWYYFKQRQEDLFPCIPWNLTANHTILLIYSFVKGINTPSVKRQAAALKFWRLPWRLGMDLGPILERHNAFQWDLATWRAAWCSVGLCLKDVLQGTNIPVQKHSPFTLVHAHLRGSGPHMLP